MEERPSSQCARFVRAACILEATARKPGNVHPGAPFADLCYDDFIRSASAIAPVIARTPQLGVGCAVLEAVRQTRDRVGRNTNLGIILLLSPLAAIGDEWNSPAARVRGVLDGLTQRDAALVYEGIRLARPGGMGNVPEQDIAAEPTETLIEVMRRAAGRDAIAAQYATGFDLVLNDGALHLERSWSAVDWERAVVGLHLWLMAVSPDTLIARKCGPEVARESARQAQDVLDAGWPGTRAGRQRFDEFDHWLRADGNRRNPGTTADLVTACLFAALREGRIELNDVPITGVRNG